MKQLVTEYPYLLFGDDHVLDQALLTQLMGRIDPLIQVISMQNGLEVFQFLDQLPQGAVFPSCIILDMDMPIWDGTRTLKVIKEHHEYHPIPCVIFSNSTAERDKVLAASLGAEAFISKTYDGHELQLIGEQLATFCKRSPVAKLRL